MIALTVEKVDKFVEKLQRKGVDVRWDGWDMVFWQEDWRGATSAAGKRRGTRWGFETVVSPDALGRWLVKYHLARVPNAR